MLAEAQVRFGPREDMHGRPGEARGHGERHLASGERATSQREAPPRRHEGRAQQKNLRKLMRFRRRPLCVEGGGACGKLLKKPGSITVILLVRYRGSNIQPCT